MGLRLAVPALLALGLMGCASSNYDDAGDEQVHPTQMAGALPRESGTNHVESRTGQQALQCVPYAREHSAIKISGDAYTWWDRAAGKYERGQNPAAGTVMVLTDYAGPNRGHVAVVRRVVSAREIRIDHANWLDDGSIYVNDPVVDVSAANDWSKVKVWNIKTGGWGVKVFPVQGFIGPGSAGAPSGSGGIPAGHEAPRDDSQRDAPNDDAPPSDAVVAAGTPDDADAPPPEQKLAATAPMPKPKAATARTVNPVIPAAMNRDERNPSPDSGFALTADDLAIP